MSQSEIIAENYYLAHSLHCSSLTRFQSDRLPCRPKLSFAKIDRYVYNSFKPGPGSLPDLSRSGQAAGIEKRESLHLPVSFSLMNLQHANLLRLLRMKQEVSFQICRLFQQFLTSQSSLPDRRNTINSQVLTYSQTPQTLPRTEVFPSVRVGSPLHSSLDLMTPQLEGNTSGSWNYLRLIEDYPTPHMSDLHAFLSLRNFFRSPSLISAFPRYLKPPRALVSMLGTLGSIRYLPIFRGMMTLLQLKFSDVH